MDTFNYIYNYATPEYFHIQMEQNHFLVHQKLLQTPILLLKFENAVLSALCS